MFKILLTIGAIFLLLRLLKGDSSQKKADAIKNSAQKVKEGLMSKDPICGIYVSQEEAVRVSDGEHTYYFCNYECRDKFLKQIESNPDSKTEEK